MRQPMVLVAISAFLVCGPMAAHAQQGPTGVTAAQVAQNQARQPDDDDRDDDDRVTTGRGMMGGGMGPHGMMGGMMGGRGYATQPPRRAPVMMRMLFALMDPDDDGSVDLKEWQSAHERFFKAIDADKDGKLTLDEMRTFMRGRPVAPAQ